MLTSPENLQVCIVTELRGGVGIYARNLIVGLQEHGIDPKIITGDPEQAVRGRVIPVKSFSGRSRWLPQSYVFAHAVKKIRDTVDVVHYTDARYSLFERNSRCPVVGTMNDYFYAITGWFSGAGTYDVYSDWKLRHLYYNMIRHFERKALHRLTNILCISSEIANVLETRYGIRRNKLNIIPYGLTFPAIPETRSNGGRRTVLFAGGNFQRKGLATLIDAGKRIVKRFPDVQFRVLGNSPDENILQRMCRNAGLNDAFAFCGTVNYETLFKEYQAANVFVMPSILEAFGIPYLEAMHCGVPVIASNVKGPDDFLQDKYNCLISQVGNPDDLADCVAQVFEDTLLQQRLIENGRQTVERYTRTGMIKKTLEVYLNTIRG